MKLRRKPKETGEIPEGIRKQKQALHSHWGKVFAWGYLGFAIITIGFILKPSGGEQTIIHSNRYDVDIVYDRALTKQEMPTYDPIVWERDHAKSEDFTIRYIDQSAWDYERYKLSSVDIIWVLMIPVFCVGSMQFFGTFSRENKIKRVVDSQNVYFSKKDGVKQMQGYYEVTIYDPYKIPILGIYWLRYIGYTIRVYSELVTHDNDHVIAIAGVITGYNVSIERNKNYRKLVEATMEIQHLKSVRGTLEGIIQDNYKIPARIVEDMTGLIENIVKAVRLAGGDKREEEKISQKAVKEIMKILKMAKQVETSV